MLIRNRLLLSFLICILIAFLSASCYFTTFIIPTSKQISLDNANILTQTNSNIIDSWLKQRINELRIINELPATKKLKYDEVRPYIINLNKLLQKDYGSINETFAIGSKDGKGWINDELYIDISKREYFKHLMDSDLEYYISIPLISKSDNNPIFIICYAITDNDNNKIGFINGAVNLELFNDILQSTTIYNGVPWIMNNNGSIYNFKNNKIDSNITNYINNTKLTKGHYITEHSTTFFQRIESSPDLTYAITIENSNLYSNTYKMYKVLIMFSLIIIAFIGFMVLIQTNYILNPINKISEQVNQISSGNLKFRNNLKGKDELAKLGLIMNQMCIDIEESIDQVKLSEKKANLSELKALQMQINQHFLYNTLDTLQWKALSHKDHSLSDMIYNLSQFFRLSLSNGRSFITIEDEVNHVTSYLKIQSMRFDKSFSYNVNLADNINQIMIPKLIIQPLVENSLTHGFISNKGIITITIEKQDTFISISVLDNGQGIKKEILDSINSNIDQHVETNSYGIFNINEKLLITYGKNYSFIFESQEHKYTKVTIKIPLIEEIDNVKNFNL